MQYKDADKFAMFNDKDPDLLPIKLMLPIPPAWEHIDGFGLPAKKQMFKVPEYPKRLKELEERVVKNLVLSQNTNKNDPVTGQKIIDGINEALDKERHDYIDEIIWIKNQWYYMEYGYWCFIDGKPTYIDGWHYRFLTTWRIEEIGLPEYRDRDRRKFIFYKWAYTTREDENWIDRGKRTLFGVVYPKHRRDGATHNALCVIYAIISTRLGVLGGIQSFDEDNAGEHFQSKLVPAWQDMPFYVKPMWRGSNAPQKELSFSNPQNRVVGSQLRSRINYATTAKKKFYDGKKQYANLSDEEGKTLMEDIVERWRVVRLTLAQGAGAMIHGFSLHPSTVAEMDTGGGDKFFTLVNQSMFENRISISGQTSSGLITLFMRASDGLEGFIGPFGESVEDDPTEEQAEFIGKKYGSRRYIEETLNSYLAKGTQEDMESYRNFSLLHPQYLSDCFRVTSGDTGFDYQKLDTMLSNYKRALVTGDENIAERGNYMWDIKGQLYSAGEFLEKLAREPGLDGFVVWVPDDEGRWYASKVLGGGQSNLRVMTEIGWGPDNNGKYTLGGDPFQFLKRNEAKELDNRGLSDGGGAIFEERDRRIDPPEKDISSWDSHRFVADYRYRPDSDDEYCEEMLMAAIYWGADIYPEVNVKALWKHIVKRGFEGYLLYGTNPITKEPNDSPGYSLGNNDTKQLMFNLIKKYIKYHVLRDKHFRIWSEARKIKGMDYLTKFDTLAAAGGCLLGSYEKFEIGIGENVSPFDITQYYEEYKY